MTDEKLIRANEIKRKLENVEERIELVTEMEEKHLSISIRSEIGSVIVDEETRDTVCGIVLNSLLKQAAWLRKEFQEL